MNTIVYKQFKTKATSINEADFTITFKVSDSKVDRQGEIVSQKDWQMANYLANPVLLFGHDPSKPEYVIGRCINMEYNQAEDCHYGTYQLDAKFNSTALLIWNQLVAGTLRTVSLGFISHDYEMQDDVPVLSGIEPLETSVVPIPANAGALAKSYQAGQLDAKDARYLMKTMREEADRIDDQLRSSHLTNKEKSMTEEQAASLMEAVTKLGETVAANQAAVEERLAALTPAAETDEEKAAREAKEASDKAEADKKAADEQAAKDAADKEAADKAAADKVEADKKAAEEEAAAVDDDTEITPEQQAEIDATLEAHAEELAA